jgi:histidine phosphotransferase ChpT
MEIDALARHPAGCGNARAVAPLTMSVALDLRVLELLTARLCHELSGPIAAIGNGVELIGDDDPDFARDALALVQDSARRAANRLQFYRFSYGFGGDAATAGPAPFELAAKLFETTPIVCDFAEGARALPLDRQKVGCNLLLVGAEALVRGGRLALDAAPTGLQLDAVGEAVSFAPEQIAALRLEIPVGALTSRTVQAYFAGLLARMRGWRLVGAEPGPGRFRVISIEAAG